MNKQQGVGLPEVMISLLLSSFIMIVLMNQYLNLKQHYLYLQSAMDEAMELDWVVDFMRDSIRQAGFTPCSNMNYLVAVDQRDPHQVVSLSAFDIGSGLTIHRMSPSFNLLLNKNSASQLVITRTHAISDDKPIMIADCYHAEVQNVMRVRNTSDRQVLTLASPLAFTYQSPVYVGEWLQERFYLRSPRGLLYKRHHAEELSPLIKTMKLSQKMHEIDVHFDLLSGRSLTFKTRVRAL